MGSPIFVSSAILHIRKRAFEKKLEELAARKKRARARLGRTLTFSLSRRRSSASGLPTDAIASGAVRGTAIKENHEGDQPELSQVRGLNDDANTAHQRISRESPPIDAVHTSIVSKVDPVAGGERQGEQGNRHYDITNRPNDHVRFGDDDGRPARDPRSPTSSGRVSSDQMRPMKRSNTRLFVGSGVGVRSLQGHPRNARPLQTLSQASTVNEMKTDKELGLEHKTAGINKYLKTINGYIGRNSQFHNLTEKERRKLGGIEYDAICLLSYVVPIYFILWQLLGALGVGAWFQINAPGVTLRNGWTSPNFVDFILIANSKNRSQPILDWCFLCDKCLQQFRHGIVGCQRNRNSERLLPSSHFVASDPGRQYVLSTVPSPHSLDCEERHARIVKLASNAKVANYPDVYP